MKQRHSLVSNAKHLRNNCTEAEHFLWQYLKKSQVEGVINQAAGAAQDLYGQAKETASDAAQAIRHGAVDAEDYIRHTIEKRPYTTAIVALCVGFLIGRMGRRDW